MTPEVAVPVQFTEALVGEVAVTVMLVGLGHKGVSWMSISSMATAELKPFTERVAVNRNLMVALLYAASETKFSCQGLDLAVCDGPPKVKRVFQVVPLVVASTVSDTISLPNRWLEKLNSPTFKGVKLIQGVRIRVNDPPVPKGEEAYKYLPLGPVALKLGPVCAVGVAPTWGVKK